MRVITSFKTTNLDLHGEVVAHKITQGQLAAHHLSTLQKDHDHHQRSRDALMKELKKHGITAVEVRRGMYWPDMDSIDAVIAVGGDGTLLEASHHIKNSKVPLVGIRSSPLSVGFLWYCSFEGISEMVEELAEQRLPAVLTSRLQGRIRRVESGFETFTVPILNDLLYTNRNPAATSRYKLSFAGKEEIQRSSGIWIATPAGSTGAISAAGGRQVSIRSQEMQFSVRELHRIGDARGMTQLQQGFFDPDSTPLVIENHSMEGMVALDGHQGKIDLGFGDTLTVCRAEALRLVSELT